jgi:2-aminoethylphosphonate-pyruvate transaminase
LTQLGVKPFLPETAFSSMISSFLLPQGWSYDRLHDQLRAAGFVIYAGQASYYYTLFRICNMGAIQTADLERLLVAFRRLLG